MLPSIALLLSVEMIRDGGSLAAIFQGSNGSQYWLFFKVNQRPLPSGEIERTGYLKPVVIDRLTRTGIEISWQHANILLNQMRPLVREDRDREWLEIMAATVSGQGELPAGVARVSSKFTEKQ
jgi:hypothetical protein